MGAKEQVEVYAGVADRHHSFLPSLLGPCPCVATKRNYGLNSSFWIFLGDYHAVVPLLVFSLYRV